jgi:hypothetical protein
MTQGNTEDGLQAYVVLSYGNPSSCDAKITEIGTWLDDTFRELDCNRVECIDALSIIAGLMEAKEWAELFPETKVMIGFGGVLPDDAEGLEAAWQVIAELPKNVFLLGYDAVPPPAGRTRHETRYNRIEKWVTAVQKELGDRCLLLCAANTKAELDLLDATDRTAFNTSVGVVKVLRDWLESELAAV